MPETPAQRRAKLKYKREKMKQLIVPFYPTDMELWDYLCTKDNKAGFVKSLIRREMELERNASSSVEN